MWPLKFLIHNSDIDDDLKYAKASLFADDLLMMIKQPFINLCFIIR